MEHLYRWFDSDTKALLYIGISNNVTLRVGQHMERSLFTRLHPRVTMVVEPFPSRAAVEVAEKAAIITERPRYNRAHNAKPLTLTEISEALNAARSTSILTEQRYDGPRPSHQDTVARMSLDELFSGEEIDADTFDRRDLDRALWHLLPYGRWLCADGRQVWFTRRYVPLISLRPGGKVNRADHYERVPHVEQEFFYVDAAFNGDEEEKWRQALGELVVRWRWILRNELT